jgi:hypothetical protein
LKTFGLACGDKCFTTQRNQHACQTKHSWIRVRVLYEAYRFTHTHTHTCRHNMTCTKGRVQYQHRSRRATGYSTPVKGDVLELIVCSTRYSVAHQCSPHWLALMCSLLLSGAPSVFFDSQHCIIVIGKGWAPKYFKNVWARIWCLASGCKCNASVISKC